MQIALKDIHFAYNTDSNEPVLSGLTCTIDQGELIGIIGKTGSGKSTFLQICAGFLTPQSGEIRVNGSPMTRARNWNEFRSKVGLVFQFPEKQLFEESVFADVAFGVARVSKDSEEIKIRVHAALEESGLSPEAFVERSPHHLSSGEQRKVALAGIVAMDPEILFIDEPTLGLDRKGTADVESLILQLVRKGKTVCVVSHNLDFVVRTVDRVIVIADKAIKYDGSKYKLFYDHKLLHSLQLEKPEIVTLCEAVAEQQKCSVPEVYDIKELVMSLKRTMNSQESFVKGR